MNAELDGEVDIETGIGFAVEASAPLVLSGSIISKFLFSGVSTVSLPQASGTANQEIYTYTLSDSLPITTIERTDAGRGYIAAFRMEMPLTAPPLGTRGQAGVDDSLTAGTIFDAQGFSQGNTTADTVNNPSSTPTFSSSSVPGVLIMEATTPMISLMGVGDSITQGLNGVTDLSGAGRYAAEELSTDGELTSYVNFGSSAMATPAYLLNFQNSLAHAKPTIAFLFTS